MLNNVTLVTGASGFLGHAVMELLAHNAHRAIGLDPQPSPTTQILDDLSDGEKLKELLVRERVTHVIHAGGVSGPMVMADDPVGVIGINVVGSLNLLRAAVEAGVKTFVYCLSVSALGNFYEDEPVGEEYPLRPTSTYGASKAAVNIVLRGLWGKIPLDLCSLRYTAIYGPGRQTVFTIEKIVSAALAGGVARIEPLTDWPYVYIDDAAQAAVSACFSEGAGSSATLSLTPKRLGPTISRRRRRQLANLCGLKSTPASRFRREDQWTPRLQHAISGFAPK